MHTAEQVILMNICMIYDDHGNVLVQNRRKKSWPGVAFPGGHVEPGEALVPSVIREVKEETGLTIHNPQLCGVKQWFSDDGTRSMVFFYKTNQFEGELQSSAEGEVFWVSFDRLGEYPLAKDFEKNMRIFQLDEVSELFYESGHDTLLEY